MTQEDRERWNARYRQGQWDHTPNRRLVALVGGQPVPPGARALDIACGAGRNSLYLARLGYVVDSWDISEAALEILAAAAQQQGLAERVQPRRADLDQAEIPPTTYHLVVDCAFLDRRLFSALAAALVPGGLLFMETYMDVPGRPTPTRPEFLLQRGELAAAFPALTTLHYEEDPASGRATLLGRKDPLIS